MAFASFDSKNNGVSTVEIFVVQGEFFFETDSHDGAHKKIMVFWPCFVKWHHGFYHGQISHGEHTGHSSALIQ